MVVAVDQKSDSGIIYKQMLINTKLQIGKRGEKFHQGAEVSHWIVVPSNNRQKKMQEGGKEEVQEEEEK
jgi:hypothetical protein